MNIIDLPKDCIREIWVHLTIVDIIHLSEVCKDLYVSSDEIKFEHEKRAKNTLFTLCKLSGIENRIEACKNIQDMFNLVIKDSMDVYAFFIISDTKMRDIIHGSLDIIQQNGWDSKESPPSILFLKLALWCFPEIIRLCKDQTEDIQMVAINRSKGTAIRYIDNPSVNVQKEAIRIGGEIIMFLIKNPSEEIKMFAIDMYPYSLEYIKDPSYEMQKRAIMKCGRVIKFVPNPSEELQLIAINDDWGNIECIINPAKFVLRKVIEISPRAIKYIKNPSEEIQMLAVMNDNIDNVIQFIEKPISEVQKLAVEKSILSFLHIKNPSDDVVRYVYSKFKEQPERSLVNKLSLHSSTIAKFF